MSAYKDKYQDFSITSHIALLKVLLEEVDKEVDNINSSLDTDQNVSIIRHILNWLSPSCNETSDNLPSHEDILIYFSELFEKKLNLCPTPCVEYVKDWIIVHYRKLSDFSRCYIYPGITSRRENMKEYVRRYYFKNNLYAIKNDYVIKGYDITKFDIYEYTRAVSEVVLMRILVRLFFFG